MMSMDNEHVFAMHKTWLSGILAAVLFVIPALAQEAKSARQIIAEAIVLSENSDAQVKLVMSLTGMSDPEIEPLLTAWKEGTIYLAEGSDDKLIAVTLAGDPDATKRRPPFVWIPRNHSKMPQVL